MGLVAEWAERFWNGEGFEERTPFAPLLAFEEVAPGVAFVSSFANVVAIATDAGLVLVDTGSALLAAQVHLQVREWKRDPVNTAIFTHGHIDHVFGTERFEQESRPPDAPPFRVVAHRAVAARFDRYKLTRGYNACINARQFSTSVEWPAEFRYPDQSYDDRLDLDVGGTRFELHHARGETDDHTFVWVPSRKVLCTGDLFIWASPNAGNPQKVQRYPLEWARALRSMASLDAECLCPGHGVPILGRARVRRALEDTAALLESLCDQTLAAMNSGMRLDEVLQAVRAPRELLERPYLRPTYDEPEFIVRNLWRQFGGWYDGNPAHLKPAPDASLAFEVARLAGGATNLAHRAEQLAEDREYALACHLAEMAAMAAPKDDAIVETRARIYRARAEHETSLMARGIFNAAAEHPPPKGHGNRR